LGIANAQMERVEQVAALIIAAGLAVVSYQLFSPARRDVRPSREIHQKAGAIHRVLYFVKP